MHPADSNTYAAAVRITGCSEMLIGNQQDGATRLRDTPKQESLWQYEGLASGLLFRLCGT